MKIALLWLIFLCFFTLHHSLIAKSLSHSTTQPTIESSTTINAKPSIQHGIDYKPVYEIKNYFVSEKLDGVRGYWNGESLITRQGNIINSPDWFTQNWPAQAIDGELWIERNQFQRVLSCVRKKQPEQQQSKSCWRDVRFMMFDLPQHGGSFTDRVSAMKSLITQVKSPYFAMISQTKFNTLTEVDNRLASVMAMQGEGLMLHLDSAYYKKGRNTALMKLKKYQDAEAVVIGHSQGTGKYKNHLGALKVKTPEGIEFKIGSGFTDKQRANPPKIGSTITYKYNGFTSSGVPRFARYWRIRVNE